MTTAAETFQDKPPLYASLEDMIVASAEAVRPPERLTVTEAGERYHVIRNKTYSGPWSREKTPYLVEPQDELQSLEKTGLAFVGPARSGKSMMFMNWLAYTAVCDPVDMMVVQMTMARAREWSQDDLAKFLRHSPEIAKRMVPGRQNDNVHDKVFLSGMRLTIKHPSITELSGKTIPRLWLMDYDREPIEVDGEGSKWVLTKKRAQTFGRHGMCVAEASPGFDVTNAKWIAESRHEAPPCEGLLSIYNTGDRRRWYWDCPHCHGKFEPDFALFDYPDTADVVEASEAVTMPCPHCGTVLLPEQQFELNLGGRWVREGQVWNADGTVSGTPRRSDVASFWLKGPAAAYTTWPELVKKYLQAQQAFDRTGSEDDLRSVTNTDLGLPYVPKAIEAGRLPEELKDRAEDWGGSADNPVVPDGVRFIVKTVDVQARSFVVQTHGITADGDIAIIEMKKLRWSVTPDDRGERQPIDPAARPEDWDVLIDELTQVYPLGDGSDRFMRVKAMGCDSGGKEGVTANAYQFVRRIRQHDSELARRFHLLKGAVSKTAPRVTVSMPDANRKDRFAGARGEIPVLLVNSNLVKDQASAMLGRTEAGGMVRFPAWAPDWLYTQLTTEIRTAKGWENLSRKRNEAWDLLVYALAICLHSSVRLEQIDWEKPPIWAADWDENDLVFSGSRTVAARDGDDEADGLAALAEKLG